MSISRKEIERQGLGHNGEIGATVVEGAEAYCIYAGSTRRADIDADIQGFGHSRATASEAIHGQGN